MKSRPVTYPRPSPGTRTGRVWEVADRITQETGQPARRSEVLKQIAQEDGNLATASTQYQYWKSTYESAGGKHSEPPDHLRDVAERSLRVAPDGRFVIPRDMRDAMMLNESGQVTACVESGELRLMSREAAIRRVQEELRKFKRSGQSVVDEFLAERRTMWGED